MKLMKFLTAFISGTMLFAAAGCRNGSYGSAVPETSESSVTEKNVSAMVNVTEEKKSLKTIVPTEENVKPLGRTCLINDTLWCALSGTGAEFEYTGKELLVTIEADGASAGGAESQARAAIYVNGKRVIDAMIDEHEKTFKVFTSCEAETINVKVVKLSESAMSTFGIKPFKIAEDEIIIPSAAKTRKIEFIGDSITCGYGVDENDPANHFSAETEDVTKSYAYKTAEALNADCSIVSISGYGVISGYTDNPDRKTSEFTMPQYYEKTGFSFQSFAGIVKPQDTDWDFSRFVPDIVVINLGTNDSSYCGSDTAKQREFIDGYTGFLKNVRKNNPESTIICTLGIMGTSLCDSVITACSEYTAETGDNNISFAALPKHDGSLGYGADFHPSAATQEESAAILTEVIKNTMGW